MDSVFAPAGMHPNLAAVETRSCYGCCAAYHRAAAFGFPCSCSRPAVCTVAIKHRYVAIPASASMHCSLAPWLLPSLPAGGPAPEPRRDAAAAVYSSGPTDYLAVFGGTTADSTHLNDMWLFSLTQRTWTLVPIVVRMSLVRHCLLSQGVPSRPRLKARNTMLGVLPALPACLHCTALYCTVLHCTVLHACLQLESFALPRLACRVLPTSHLPADELP